MAVAMAETRGDPGHTLTRRTYENLGFGVAPVARYCKPTREWSGPGHLSSMPVWGGSARSSRRGAMSSR